MKPQAAVKGAKKTIHAVNQIADLSEFLREPTQIGADAIEQFLGLMGTKPKPLSGEINLAEARKQKEQEEKKKADQVMVSVQTRKILESMAQEKRNISTISMAEMAVSDKQLEEMNLSTAYSKTNLIDKAKGVIRKYYQFFLERNSLNSKKAARDSMVSVAAPKGKVRGSFFGFFKKKSQIGTDVLAVTGTSGGGKEMSSARSAGG
ncbi:MAG TPA: hypothetical protein VIK81_03900 [Patescibacteria group bacterium]